MHDRPVAERDLLFQNGRMALDRHVHGAVVLDVGPCADPDGMDVAAKDGAIQALIAVEMEVDVLRGPSLKDRVAGMSAEVIASSSIHGSEVASPSAAIPAATPPTTGCALFDSPASGC